MNKPQRYDIICPHCQKSLTILTERTNERIVVCSTCRNMVGVVENHVLRMSKWAIEVFKKRGQNG